MESTRRTILASGIAAAAGTALAGRAGSSASNVSSPLGKLLHFSDEFRTAAAEDFGHIVHRLPEAVLRPGSAQDTANLIRLAGDLGYKIAPQGQRHSVYGRGQVQDGLVIDMTRLAAVHQVENDRIVVDAGTKWSAVLGVTLPLGLTPPVLTDYLELSVGGTLVVGGVGSASSRHGMQCDSVLELEVVTGKGEELTCSPRNNADLFDAVRAGLGQTGIITRATLKLIPAPKMVRRYVLTYPDLKTMLRDGRLLAGQNRFDALQGTITPTPSGGTFRIDAASYIFGDEPPDDDALLAGLSDKRAVAQQSTLTYLDYLNRLAALEKTLRSNGQWFYPHPWLMTFVGDSAVDAVVGAELERLTHADFGTFGQIVLSAFRRPASTSPLLRLPDGNLLFVFNLVRIPATDSVMEADRLVKDNRAIYERVRAAGGTLYPVSALPMTPDDWRRHFGPAWAQLRDAKNKFDPRHILTPGYEVF